MNYNDYWKMLCCMRRMKEVAEQAMHPFCEEWGITPMQMHVLLALHFEGPKAAGELARACGMAGANASVLCKRLDALGYISRQRPPGDERLVMMSLTDKGSRAVAAFARQIALGGLPPPATPMEAEKIARGLEALGACLQGEPARKERAANE